jgi:hypothetical protein
MNIKVRDKDLGECNIKTYNNIGKDEEYLIKSLCILQLMCINSKEDPEKFDTFIGILKEATQKAEDLYNDNIKESSFDAVEQFNV